MEKLCFLLVSHHCFINGFSFSGAFLVPYVIYMLLMGMPLVVLEMGYGQFSSLSPIAVWRMSPLFQGNSSVTHLFYLMTTRACRIYVQVVYALEGLNIKQHCR